MLEKFISLNYIYQSLIASTFTYLVAALGASIVFFIKKINNYIMNVLLSISSGIMLAASYFSLLSPSIEYSISLNQNKTLIPVLGFLTGSIFIFIIDKILNKTNIKNKTNLMLMISMTIHNIPEGLIVGISFGSLYYGIKGMSIMSSIMLAFGIALQNFPEGAAVSLPLLNEGHSRKKAFFYGQLSSIVEPIFGLLGAILVLKIKIILPFSLSLAAGAMTYVIISELLPNALKDEKKEHMALYTIIGFIIMMILDVTFS